MDGKERAALEAAKRVEKGMVVGLGTGTTADYFIRELGRKIREEGFSFQGVPSSFSSAILAREHFVPLLAMDQVSSVDLYVDGADEVDPGKGLLKGRGAAMVREKLLAHCAAKFLVVADAGKLVDRLGTRFPVPVEVLPFGWRMAQQSLAALGAKSGLRQSAGKDGPVVTDQGNFVLDAVFPKDADWISLDLDLDAIPGVVGHGLFLRYAAKTTVLIGTAQGVETLT